MLRPRELLRTAVSGSAAVGITGFMSPVVAGLSLVNTDAADLALWTWAETVLRSAGVKTVCLGLENLPTGNFVLVANHQSHFDALVLFRHIRRHMRFVAKQQLRGIPVFGWALEKAGNIFVDRSGGDGDKATLHEAARAVRERVSVVFFAEGTRSEDGVLRPFKKGAAVMALEARVPMVPVAVAGTWRILEKGGRAIHPRPSALVIGEPISTAGLPSSARDALTLQAHDRVEALLAEGNRLVDALER